MWFAVVVQWFVSCSMDRHRKKKNNSIWELRRQTLANLNRFNGLQQRIHCVAMVDALLRVRRIENMCVSACGVSLSLSLPLDIREFFANIVFFYFYSVVAVVRCFIFANIWPCFWHVKTHASVCVWVWFAQKNWRKKTLSRESGEREREEKTRKWVKMWRMNEMASQ